MRHAWIDASAGTAGDMLLGALLDAGADLGAVQAAVDAVIADSVTITLTPVTRAGLRATKAEVEMLVTDPPHRSWQTIKTMIESAALAVPVRQSALMVFARLADAEARVHGMPAEDVHFHEVGALDSIADVVGCCAALHDLGVVAVSASEVALGSGHVQAAHGTIPVPVPAVTELSQGWRVRGGGRGERTTPTGMALLAVLAERCEDLPALVVERVGVGAGTKDFPGAANVTRVIVGDKNDSEPPGGSPAVLLEANVDDFDPRLWPGVLDALLSAGANDAWLVPILMKKGRPAHILSVLSEPAAAARLRALMLSLTSTLGVRQTATSKHAIPRSWVNVDVVGAPVSIKLGYADGLITQVSAEFDSIAARAIALGRPQHDVLTAAMAAAARIGLVVGAPVSVLDSDEAQ